MRRIAVVLITNFMAIALCVCPVVAKMAPRGAASQRPAKVRRLNWEGVLTEATQGELATSADFSDCVAQFAAFPSRIAEEHRPTAALAVVASFWELCSRSFGLHTMKGPARIQSFCGGVCPLRC
jgi:hypothetical protein